MSAKRYSIVQALGDEFTVGKSSGGFPQISVPLRIVEGDRTGEQIVYYATISSEKGAEYTAAALRALGMSNDDIFNPVGIGSVKAKCTEQEDTWEGKTRFKVRWLNPLHGRRTVESLEDTDRDQFQAMMDAALAGEETVDVDDRNKAGDIPQLVTASEKKTGDSDMPF